ncbi:MAG: hypothetical protein EBZ77_03040 [Chitinophagia bacterium]|nr:hypothetical protein [Chitinophagia bacterium]
MNRNKSVVTFTIVTTLLLFAASLANSYYHIHNSILDNLSILADVVSDTPQIKQASQQNTATTTPLDSLITIAVPTARTLEMYQQPGVITAFNADTGVCALQAFMAKLDSLRKTGKGKIRIAWIGDSMIEGDLLTQTVRKKFQEWLGKFGVGFIAANSISANFRSTATHKWNGKWTDITFKDKDSRAPLYLSGHYFYTDGGSISITDKTIHDTTQPIYKTVLCGQSTGTFTITVNGAPVTCSAPKAFNAIVVDSSTKHNVQITWPEGRYPVYGVAMEPQSGVVVDNYSFRGITGLELMELDTNFLQLAQQEHPYDLVILEYGANLMFRPNDVDYSWYEKNMMKTLSRFCRGIKGAELLIVSTSDRAFKYGDSWQSAVGIDNLIKAQAELAYENKAAFYNMYATMGGSGTIVKWADSTNPLANKDYIHPNHKGAEILGSCLFTSFMNDYRKYLTAAAKVDSIKKAASKIDSQRIAQ